MLFAAVALAMANMLRLTMLSALSWMSWFLCHDYSCCYHNTVLAILTMLLMTSFVRLASPWYLSCRHRTSSSLQMPSPWSSCTWCWPWPRPSLGPGGLTHGRLLAMLVNRFYTFMNFVCMFYNTFQLRQAQHLSEEWKILPASRCPAKNKTSVWKRNNL